MPNKDNKVLIEYNCKNGVYSVDRTEVKSLPFLVSVTLDKTINTKTIYGDGELQLSIISDRGSTGSLESTARDDDFETDLGFLMPIAQGLAERQVIENKNISVGFEVYRTYKDGTTKTKKVWLLGVNVSPASEALSQNKDTANEATASYGLTVKGENLKSGDDDYRDENGNTVKIYKITSLPNMEGYATFLDSVPTPTVQS